MRWKSQPLCWAASVGECEGPITGEHLVTEALLTKRVLVEYSGVLRGDERVDVPLRKLKANILCRKHNGELGRTADMAAIRLLRALRAMRHPLEHRGSRILRPPVDRHVSGVDYGRWLCKTHCNLLTANGLKPSMTYVRYAFQVQIDTTIHFFFEPAVDDLMRLGNERESIVSWSHITSPIDQEFEAFSISLGGFSTAVSSVVLERNGRPMMDRIRELHHSTPLGMFRILIDWRSDPTTPPDHC